MTFLRNMWQQSDKSPPRRPPHGPLPAPAPGPAACHTLHRTDCDHPSAAALGLGQESGETQMLILYDDLDFVSSFLQKSVANF